MSDRHRDRRPARSAPASLAGSLCALVALVALLVGIPLLLMRYADWPITGMPSAEQIRDLPETALGDEALFGVLTVALWTAWALFVLSVVVEVVGRMTGRASRVNVGGPLQRLAARLVGSLLLSVGPVMVPLLGSSAPAMASPAVPTQVAQTPPETLPVPTPTSLDPTMTLNPATQSQTPAPATPTQTPSTPGAPTQAPGADVVVQPGDHFWGIAKSTLTDAWGRVPTDSEMVGYWLDLVEANRHLLVPPHDPNLIHPQQVFDVPPVPADPVTGTMPPPAPAPTPPPTSEPTSTPPTEPTTPTTEDGGSGSGSTDTTGTTQSDPDSSDTTGTTQSPEGTGPDGSDTTNTTGDSGDDGTENDPEDTVEPPDGDEEEPPDDEDDSGEEDTDPDPGTGDDAQQQGGTAPPDASTGSSVSGTETAADDQAEDDGGGSSVVPLALAVGGMALAGGLVVLERRRRVQQRYRTRGRRIRMPEGSLATAEQSFRQAAQVDRAELVDYAVRAAASRSEATGLPALRWVEASDETVTLVLGSPVAPPPGFDWEGRDRWVSTATPDELAALANGSGPPAPALVPVGVTRDEVEVLVDLEASGLVEVAGPPAQVANILRSLALAAATSPWADDAKVRLVGLGPELARHDWVTLCSTLSEALDEAEAQVEKVSDALRGLRCQTTREARAVSVNPTTWSPVVVVSAVPPADADEQRRLERMGDRPDCGVAVVVPAVDDRGVTARRLDVGDDGWVSIGGVDPEVRPHALDDGAVSLVADLLDVADDRVPVQPTYDDEVPVRRTAVPVAKADDQLAPPDPLEAAGNSSIGGNGGLATLMAEVDVVVRVLGEVEVVRRAGDSWDTGRTVEIARQKALEAIAYLAMRDTAVEREDLEINLFPDGANATKTVYNIISAARKAVGDDLFPVSDGRRYGLSDRVVTDYALFYELIAQADETDDPGHRAELLAESLDLVMGEPFTGAGRSFSWVGPHRGIIVAQVIDAAEELAELHLDQRDWRAAEWAARKGLRAFPADERMYRILMRTAAQSGNVPGVQRVYRELCQVIADPDDGVEPDDAIHPETIALLEELTGTRSAS